MDEIFIEKHESRTIRELIDRMASTQAEAPFLISPETGRVLTFIGLREQSRAISALLRKAGLERGDKVAFLLDNGLFTAQLFLGTMYAGLGSVPLNVRAGAAQLTYTLDHCGAKVVFVEAQYEPLLQEGLAGVSRAVRVIPADVDSFAGESETPIEDMPLATPAAEDEALLMYTSGSVGQPKGAVHTHRTLLAHGRNSICSHQLTSADRSLLVLPMYHINAECVTLLPTLLSGGSVVVPHRFDISRYWDWLDEYRCTWSAVVPTIISQLLDWKDPRADRRETTFQRIRFIRSSSAPLSPSLQREFLDKFKLLLIQAMGSSEAGNIFSNPLPPRENKIGTPGLAWGFETRIVDGEGHDVPAGEPGEVLIRGPAIMQGYYKDAEGTAAVLDPEGWMHTSDLAYQDRDGYFFVIGRSKELIIKAGMNIAPRQIDEVLESHPSVLEAAVVGIPDRHVGEDLVAFAVLRAAMVPDERAMLAFCESRLGHFKTPTRIHFVADLPKGPSGKVQRLRLLDQAVQLATSKPVYGNGHFANGAMLTDASTIEQVIAACWAEVLKQPQVNKDSNFFSLGGTSLMAIECLSRMREKLPIALSLSDFFENPTVTQQANLVKQGLSALQTNGNGAHPENSHPAAEPTFGQSIEASKELQPIPRRGANLPYPLSSGQQRIWFFKELAPDVPLYNESEAVRLLGELNADAIERALNVVIARHEVLRATIRMVRERPMAFVRDTWQLQMKRIDLSALAPAERDAEVARLLINEPRTPYDLEAEPGIRATLLRLSPTEHVFILLMHHLVCDWASEGVLWREMSSAYRAISRGELPDMDPLAIQFGDYAVWQQQRVADSAYGEDLVFWEANLRGAPELLELPSDRPRPKMQTYRGARQRFRLNPTLTEAVRNCSRREKTTLFNVFAAAFNTLLFRYTGSEDILLGIPLADRDRAELQSVIGFLLHTHVLRTQLSASMSFRELLARVQKGLLELYSHREVPFEQVVSRIRPERNLSHSPLFQVMINWRDEDQQLSFIGLDGLAVESLLTENSASKFDLTLFLTDCGDEVWLEAEYNTDLFDRDRIARMFDHYQTLLEAVATDPGRRLAELPLLTDAERTQLLVEWNATQVSFPSDVCIHDLFERQVEQTPDAVAVASDDDEVTYRELNQRSNQLAHYLRKLGVKKDSLVGICVERSIEMIVGVLGILKAGGAYVPLDPSYPHDRLVFMLRDSGAVLLLTQHNMRQRLADDCAVVCLDSDWQRIAEEESTNPHPGLKADNLAYVIYTSGSTGRPKGVEISHRSVVNFLCSMRNQPGLTAKDTLVAVTTLSFDIAALELFLPLCVGAKLVIASRELASDGALLLEQLRACGATVLQATPITFRLLIEAGWTGSLAMKVLCGGEALPQDLADQILARSKVLWNMYGPTETTIWSAAHPVEKAKPILIGRPIANTQFYVVDSRLQPMPVGVAGELLIGGAGLARGYLNRPKLTAEKFITDPFSAQPESRLYRTGDLVRYLADGSVEFLGRIDHQVKIRGFRIELGEIEDVLRQHPGVRDAVVTAKEDLPGDKRLVAYVVSEREPQSHAAEAEMHSEYLSGWQTIWDETYRETAEVSDRSFNIAGWNSSYSGNPIAAEEMRVWVDSTVERILALHPRRILEIGCGTGLLLHRLARRCATYFATDYSANVVRDLQKQIEDWPPSPQVVLRHASADDFTGIPAKNFDVVILNSVVQYFPSIDYLVRVLSGVVEAVKPGGAIFLGDIRSEQLLNAFHAAIQLEQAPASLPLAELKQRIQRSLSQEKELCISPAFFNALRKHLPAITQVEIQLKRGHHHNELSLFRYDVVLRVGSAPKPTNSWTRLDWPERQLSVSDLRRFLVKQRPKAFTLTRVPSARLQRELKLAEVLAGPESPATAGGLREALTAEGISNAIEPEDLWTLGESLGYRTQVRWSDGEATDTCDLVLLTKEKDSAEGEEVDSAFHFPSEPLVAESWSTYANNPLQGMLVRNLVPQLRDLIEKKLPKYMVPSAITLLDAFPLTPNGKVDRKALPDAGDRLSRERTSRQLYVAPQTDLEEMLATLWRDFFGLDKIGIHDSFFDLGGDSLMATRLIREVHKRFNHRISVPLFFQNPTIEDMARILQREKWTQNEPQLIPLEPGESAGTLFFLEAEIATCRLARLLKAGPASFATVVPLTSAAVQAAVLNRTADLPSMEDLAAAHVALIRTHRHSGPCLLAGHSFGGTLAFEVAHQLEREGIRVEMILLLDPWARPPLLRQKLKRLASELKSLNLKTSYLWSKIRARTTEGIAWLATAVKSDPTYHGLEEPGIPLLDEVSPSVVAMVKRNARKNYRFRRLDGHAVLLHSQHSNADPGSVDGKISATAWYNYAMGWGGLFTNLEIVETPGDHMTLLQDPHIQVLAGKINDRLQQLRSNLSFSEANGMHERAASGIRGFKTEEVKNHSNEDVDSTYEPREDPNRLKQPRSALLSAKAATGR